jgi:CubicO group peptidase (beta-lactamase class C family)
VAATEDTEQRFETLDAIVRHEMERLQIPGLSVGTLIDGDMRTHGYGVISLETNYPTRPDSLFQIGSNTKVFTATLAMKLVEEGILNLDTPVKEYLPDLKLADEQAQATITMRHLLTHVSGLEGDRFEDTGIGDDALATFIGQAYTWSQETDPGEIWSYCNSGFSLAGRVMEHVLEMPYEEAVRDRIFKPLGMSRTFWHAHEVVMYSAAAGHSQLPGQEHPTVAHPWAIPRSSNPAGAIISNVDDILTFMQFHLGDGTWKGTQVLSGETVQAMQQQQARVNSVTEWGIGWTLTSIDGVRIISHGGSTNGHNTQMLAVPDKGFIITVLVNSDHGSQAIDRINAWALEKYCGLKKPEPERISLPPEELARFTGRYSRPMGASTVTAENGGLMVETAMVHPLTHEEIRMPAVRLEAIGNNEFIATEGDYEGMRIDFVFGDGDRPRFMRFGYRLVPRDA